MASPPSRAAVLAACCVLTAACGQKGPPLAPLRLVPAAVTDVSLRRIEDRVRLRFVLPTSNANGPGRIDLDRVEVFAMTVGAGAPAPPNRDLLTKAHLVGQIPVRPAPVEGELPPEGEARPAPGETVTFEEALTAETLTPLPAQTGARTPDPEGAETAEEVRGEREGPQEPVPAPASPDPSLERSDPSPAPPDPSPEPETPRPEPEAPGPEPQAPGPEGQTPGVEPEGATGPAASPATHPQRIYVARGVSRSGRPGAPSTRVALPVVPVPSPPTEVVARVTETAVLVEWTPPAELPATAFNVYRSDDEVQPVNPTALTAAAFEHAGVPFGDEVCHRVRSVAVVEGVAIEGGLSEETCVTPRDVFPPAAPRGLAAVPTPGQISLIWDANIEGDLAGYLVLRGDAPDGALQALTPAPIPDTSYRDATVAPGTRYVYAVVAADTADPPNTSAQSPPVEETAR